MQRYVMMATLSVFSSDVLLQSGSLCLIYKSLTMIVHHLISLLEFFFSLVTSYPLLPGSLLVAREHRSYQSKTSSYWMIKIVCSNGRLYFPEEFEYRHGESTKAVGFADP